MFDRILDGVRDISRDRESWRARSCAALMGATALISVALSGPGSTPAAAQPQQRPNIVVIMGDDIGIWNIGAYHRGMMAGRTPNLDKIAAEGMLFTDYYAEASCTAGRANFITGELPIRTGMTTVGQAGAPTGMPAEAATIATALKGHGLRHRPVRQEPPRRQERVPADGARLRRVLRLPLSPRRDGGPLPSELPAGPQGAGRPAQHGPLARDHGRRSDRRSALGQDRQADDRGCGRALPEAHGDRGRRNPRPRAEVRRQGQGREQAVLPLAQPDPHAHRHAPVAEVPGDAQLQERLDHP